MAKLPLDLSHYKKTKDDKDYAILKHPHGHEIKIAKAPLHSKLREQLEKLPMCDGGSVQDKMASGGDVLDTNAREHIKEKNFALPGRRYPIEDETHARNALARVSQHGSPEEKVEVRSKVHSKYPGIEVSKMADGGQVANKPNAKPSNGPYIDPKSAKEVESGATKSGWQPEQWKKNIKEGLGLSEGGEIETPSKPFDTERADSESTNYAEGGPVYANSANQSASLKENYSKKKRTPYSGAAAQYADGGDVEDDSAKEAAKHITINIGHPPVAPTGPLVAPAPVQQNDNPQQATPENIAANGSQQGNSFTDRVGNAILPTQQAGYQAPKPPTPENEEMAQQQVADNQQQQLANDAYKPVQAPQQPSDDQQDPLLASSQIEAKGLSDAYNNQLQGIQAEANAKGHQGKEQAAIETKLAEDQKVQAQDYQTHLQDLDQERNALVEDIANSHIKPEHYMADMSTGKRVMTAIGLILGGMGAGLTGGENPALKYLNAQIDRDIEGQKSELGKKQNLLAANQHKFQDLNQAYQMTKINMTDIAIHNLAAQAAKAQNPIEQARAQQAIGQLQQQNAARTGQLAMMRTMLKGQQGQSGGKSQMDPARLVASVVPKDHQKEVFKEIQTAQNTKHMAGNILSAFDQAAKDVTGTGRVTSHIKTPRSLGVLHQHMQPTFADLEGTVRQAAMENTFKNITPSPYDSEADLKMKRQALEQYLQSKMSAPTAKGFGIDLSKYQSTAPGEQLDPKHQEFLDWAQKNPQDPRSAIILKKLGK